MEIRPYLRRVQFYETDAMAVVHHANYIHWMEEARVDFLDQIGYPYARCVQHGIDIGMLSLQCQYKGMARFGDTVSVELSMVKMTNARMTLRYRMTDAATGELRFLGESSHFFYDHATGRPAALRRALPELHALLLARLEEGAQEER